MAIKQIKQMFHEMTEHFFPEKKSFWQENKYYFLGGGLIVVVAGGFYGYRAYTTQRNAEAFGVLGRYVERYLKADNKKDARLDDGALALESRSFSGSAASPFFTAYEAQDLLNQGKIAEAAPMLKNAVAAMPSGSPLTALYKVKLALVQLDLADQASREEGLKGLKALADDQSSPAWDVASYYLGRYHWVKNEVDEAKKIWSDALAVIEKAHATGTASRYSDSPWLARAERTLKSIV
jgi:hypothetical protein